MKREKAIDAFKKKCVSREDTGCFEWTGSFDKRGYAIFSFGGKTYRAARWLQKHKNKEIPSNFDASHVCHNKRCVRPHAEHVILEGHGDNMKRSAERELWAGEKNSYAKSKDDSVLALKLLTRVTPIPIKYISKALNIPERSAYYQCREGWKHLNSKVDLFIAELKDYNTLKGLT